MITTSRQPITMTGTGFQIPNSDRSELYVFIGSGTRVSNYAVTADLTDSRSVSIPHKCRILYLGQWILNGNSIDFFGLNLTAKQAVLGGVLIDVFYDGAGNYTAKLVSDPTTTAVRSYWGTQTHDVTLTSPPTNVSINPATNPIYQRLIGSGTLTGNFSIAPSGTFNDGEHFIYKWDGSMDPDGKTININGVVLTDEEVKLGDTSVLSVRAGDMISGAWINQKIKGSGFNLGETIDVPIIASFETNEVGKVSYAVSFPCKVKKVQWSVLKTIAATDNGAADLSINATPMTPATISIPLSSTVGDRASTNITADNVLVDDDLLEITTSKVTPGGRVLFIVTLERVSS